jgi:hypothetical protein
MTQRQQCCAFAVFLSAEMREMFEKKYFLQRKKLLSSVKKIIHKKNILKTKIFFFKPLTLIISEHKMPNTFGNNSSLKFF